MRKNFNLLPIKGKVTLIYTSRTQSYQRFSMWENSLALELPTAALQINPTGGLTESKLTFYRVGVLTFWKR